MYLLWIFSDRHQRGKAFRLPAVANWSGRLDISKDILYGVDGVYLPVTAENNRWNIYLPEGYAWEGAEGNAQELNHEGVYRLKGEQGSLVIMASLSTKETTVLHKYCFSGREYRIGKQPGNDICYDQRLVSGNHGTITAANGQLMYADYSSNGSWVNGSYLRGQTTALKSGDTIFIAPALTLVVTGDFFAVNMPEGLTVNASAWEQRQANRQAPADLPMTQQYHRSPRLMQQPNVEDIVIDPPIERDRDRSVPVWLAIGPSMTMILPMLVSSVVMGRSMGASLVMMGTSSALSIMWSSINRKYTAKEKAIAEENRQQICQQYYAEQEEKLIAETEREKKRLNMLYLPVRECVKLPTTNDHRLWERLPRHEDFLTVRLGVGEKLLPSHINVQKQKINLVDDPLRHRPQELKDRYQVMKDAPIVLDPKQHQIIGVLGNSSSPWLMQSVVAQIAATHSYHDVRMIILYNERDAEQWKFTHRLPHVYAADDRTLRLSVCHPRAIDEVLSYFEEVLHYREDMKSVKTEEDDGEKNAGPQLPWYIFVVMDPKLVEEHPVFRYMTKPGLGVTMLMQTENMESLPKDCGLIVNAGTELGTIYHADGSTIGVQFEQATMSELQSFARGINNFRIKEMTGDTSIPSLVTFLETYGVRKVTDIDICHNWNENHAWQSIRTTIGFKAGSAPFVLDISDKNHGPHGLIGGTTGAGKSVLLQSFIMSLALNYSPTEIQFILIDYKGGGTSESFRGLPHVAGIIDSSQGARTIFRALASIRGEIKRREVIFKEAGVNNIDDYMKMCNADPNELSLGHLIIVVDEFAELKKEEPEFMNELVSAARVGRSLGMHLVLATQKPGNSVSAEIDANSRFRICLRVASPSDSNELIKHPDAAYLKGMGRCYVKVGSDELYEQVQTSWSGATYNPEALRPEEEPRVLNEAGQPLKFRKRKQQVESKEKPKQEIDVVLDYISETCDKFQYDHARPLWLDEMHETLRLEEVCEMFEQPMWNGEKWPVNPSERLTVLYGMADDVGNQRRIRAEINFAELRNVFVSGLSGAGKTVLLQTLAVGLATQYSPDEVNIYVFSLTSTMLKSLKELPHVGDVVYGDEPDEQIRLMRLLYNEGERRKKLFQELSTDNFLQYNRTAESKGMKKLPAIVVMVDRMQQIRDWDGNRQAVVLERFYEMLGSSASQGIYFVITGLKRSELQTKYDAFVTGLALLQNEREDYAAALGTRIPSDWGGIREYPGRGLMAVNDKEAKEVFLYELQTAAYASTTSDQERAEAVANLGRKMTRVWTGDVPPQIARIPKEPSFAGFMQEEKTRDTLAQPFTLPLGYHKSLGEVVAIRQTEFYSGLIIGPKKSGKSNLIKIMALEMQQKGYQVLLIGAEDMRAWGEAHGITTFAHGSIEWLIARDRVAAEIGSRGRALQAAAAVSAKEKQRVADSFCGIAILIDDLDKFITSYEANDGSAEMVKRRKDMLAFIAFCVADNEKIASYKLFTYATISRAKCSIDMRSKDPFRTMWAVSRGIMLQGVSQETDPYRVASLLPELKKESTLPLGEGVLVQDDNAVRLVIPKLEAEKPAGESPGDEAVEA